VNEGPLVHSCNSNYSEGSDQEKAEIRRMAVQSQPGKMKVRPYIKNTQHKKGLEEWIKW
jgi:hypothetical protein